MKRATKLLLLGQKNYREGKEQLNNSAAQAASIDPPVIDFNISENRFISIPTIQSGQTEESVKKHFLSTIETPVIYSNDNIPTHTYTTLSETTGEFLHTNISSTINECQSGDNEAITSPGTEAVCHTVEVETRTNCVILSEITGEFLNITIPDTINKISITSEIKKESSWSALHWF